MARYLAMSMGWAAEMPVYETAAEAIEGAKMLAKRFNRPAFVIPVHAVVSVSEEVAFEVYE